LSGFSASVKIQTGESSMLSLSPTGVVAIFLWTTLQLQAQKNSGCPPPPVPKNPEEAAMMEAASNKEGCWKRDPKTGQLIFVNKNGIVDKPILKQPGPVTMEDGTKIRYVPGTTDILVHWNSSAKPLNWLAAQGETLQPAPMLADGYSMYGFSCFSRASGDFNRVVRGVSPGTYQLIPGGRFQQNNTCISAYGFDPIRVAVPFGFTAEVTLPTPGIVNVSLSRVGSGGNSTWALFTAKGKMLPSGLIGHGSYGDIGPTGGEIAMGSGSYSYRDVSGGKGPVQFTVTAGQKTSVTLPF
jgi:hypothetical protein